MKQLNYFYMVLMILCTNLAFVSCSDNESEPKFVIDPALGAEGWVVADYIGTTMTDLDSRGMIMRIDTTYNQSITLEKDSLGQLRMIYRDWTDHEGMSYGDFCIVPVNATITTEGVAISGECADSLYKSGVGYPAELRVEGTVNGEQKAAEFTLKVNLAVSPVMTLKFTLSYEGTAN